MRIAIVGTRGVPANYGGFETFAVELGRRLVARGHEVLVYCRQRYYKRQQKPALISTIRVYRCLKFLTEEKM